VPDRRRDRQGGRVDLAVDDASPPATDPTPAPAPLSSAPSRYRSAEELEAYLGDPGDAGSRMSFQAALAADEREAYPAAATRALNAWGLHRHYVPAALGGRLTSFEELLALLRVVARRDLTAAIAHGQTFVGAAPVWVGGAPALQRRLAGRLLRRQQAALALTERAHGSDILGSEVEAVAAPGGYRLSGEKWLINNATRGRALSVFARTDAAGGPRGFSVLLVEKRAADRARYAHLPKIVTHGMRGADVSGVRFDDYPVPAEAVVGAPGAGLDVVLKALQLTRTLCAGLSLGAADTALRSVVSFALERRLYGETVYQIGHARWTLADAFVDLLVADCVATAGARASQVLPEQMSVLSALVKYFVPTLLDETVRALAVVLGARHYVRAGHPWSHFQKLERDLAVVALFDGSTLVNLTAIAQQLRQLPDGRDHPGQPEEGEMAGRLADVFGLGRPLPPFAPARLALSSRGRDDLIAGLPAAAARARALAPSLEPAVAAALDARLADLIAELAAQAAELAALRERVGQGLARDPALLALARRRCLVQAGAACLQTWLHGRDELDGYVAAGGWLALALERLLRMAGAAPPASQPALREQAAGELLARHQADRLFALVPLRLAPSTNRPGTT
jgi:alkylation response protein AidB-like acyl-CoA dehydrogenase